ncbi:MAG: biotin/lipoyl-binding protein [Clostridia bacterium]|nr:biotin/lipoyl-binding protein [Clostridia bacterium]
MVLVIVVLLGIFLYVRLSDKGTKIDVVEVKTGDISDYYETTAVIESGSQESYIILDGVKVTELNVKLNDSVQEGQVLAKFDTSGALPLIQEKQKEYNEALLRYNTSVNSVSSAKTQKEDIENQIAQLEATAQPLREQVGDTSSTTTTESVMTEEELRAIIDDAGGAGSSLTQEQVQEILSQIDSTASEDSSPQAQLRRIELQISLLESQKSMIGTGTSSTLIETYKNVADSSKESLDEIKAQKAELDKGWIAKSNGVVSEINIVLGETYVYKPSQDVDNQDILSILAGLSESQDLNASEIAQQLASSQNSNKGVGLVVDNYNDYCVTFNLGKYDSQRIKLDMPSTVTFLSFDYEGYVSYISAKAQSSSSGISALTGGASKSSNTLSAKVAIKNPDENLIVGFDAKLMVKVDESKDALLVPIESLQGDAVEKYVFVYNEKEKTVSKKIVEIGISSDEYYEIKSGLKKGDKIVKNLSNDMQNGAKVYVGESH